RLSSVAANRNRIIRSFPTTFTSSRWSLKAADELSGLKHRLATFFLRPDSSIWLAVLRIGLGLQVLFYTTSLRADWLVLFARENKGLIRRDLTEAMLSADSPLIPRSGWLVDARWRGKRLRNARLYGLHRRILQLHMCIIYSFGGITKCAGLGWWNGESLWRALTRAPFDVVPPEILIRAGFLLPVVGILV